jgi:hypothetical protein
MASLVIKNCTKLAIIQGLKQNGRGSHDFRITQINYEVVLEI